MTASTRSADELNKLAVEHVRLARWLARRFRRVDDDLEGVALLELVSAIRKWDPARGPLVPYVSRRIRSALGRHARRTRTIVTVPWEFRGDVPHVSSLDAVLPGAEELTLHEVLANGATSADDELERARRAADVRKVVASLPASERETLRALYFGDDEATLEAAGAEAGIGKEGMRQRERKAIQRFRRRIT